MASPKRALIGLASALVALALMAPAVTAEWPMDGGDSAHTGVQQTGVSGPAVQWQYGAQSEILAPPAAAYSSLFLGTVDGSLVVLDEADGRLAWDVELGAAVRSTPLISTATVFVSAGNVLHAISTQNRSDKWTFAAVGDLRGSPVLEGGTVYVGSEDKHVYALDEYTGALQWKYKLDDVVAASPTITGLKLIVGTDAGTLYALHRNEGTLLWQIALGSAVSSAATVSQGLAIVGTYGGRLRAASVEDGDLKWSFPPTSEDALDPILTTPATDSGLVYFGSDGLYCLEARVGELVWHHATRDFVRGSPAIADSYLVFGSYDGALRCVDKSTGSLVWQYETGTQLRAGVSIDYDRCYAGGRNGVLYARSILNHQPPIVSGPASIMGEAHQSIRFEVVAQDPEGNVLTYNWAFGDGNLSRERAPLHSYEVAGNYSALVTVSDGTKAKTLQIQVVINPYQSRVEGGDEAAIPAWLLVVATVTVAVVIIVVVMVLRRRRPTPAAAPTPPAEGPQGQPGEAQPWEVVR